MNRRPSKVSLIASAVALGFIGTAFASFALATSKQVNENRRQSAAELQNYGQPIEVKAAENLGRPKEIVLTTSRIEPSAWTKFRYLVWEYAEAAKEVVLGALPPKQAALSTRPHLESIDDTDSVPYPGIEVSPTYRGGESSLAGARTR